MSKVSPAQRSRLRLMAEMGAFSVRSFRKATLRKIVELGLAEVFVPPGHEQVRITDRGRKYLVNWSRAYGAGFQWRETL